MQNIAAEYNATRSCKDTSVLCHAPFSNIYFNQFGQGLACCFNTNHVLGTYPHNSVSDMWYGRQAAALREAMRRDDFSAGCQGCAHQLASRNFSGIMSVFDHLADAPAALAQADRTDVEPPRSLEFSISNACNLECVMCTGDFSSSIRKRRGESRMDNPYDFQFLEQLEPFLPTLRMARFFGGEPFLIRTYYRIWDRLNQVNPDVDIRITTNGTALLDRARRLLAGLRCRITMSVDSLERETYELIRQNASYDLLRENMNYFAAYCREREFPLNLAVCPMQQNWRELPDMVAYCNENGFDIGFNTVYYPPSCSLRMLSYDHLSEVLDHWRNRASEWRPTDALQSGNISRFDGVINQVSQWREEARASSSMANLAEADATPAKRDNVDASAFSAVISVGLPTHREQLRALLERGETQAFVTQFFEALNRTYQSVGRHVPEAEQATVQKKIRRLGDILAERVTDRSALHTLSGMDARDLLAWIAVQPGDNLTSVADEWIEAGLSVSAPRGYEDR